MFCQPADNGGWAQRRIFLKISTLSAQTAPSAFPEPPALAAERAGLRLWHKADAAFRVPRVAAAFMLASPAAYGSPRAAALTHLVAKLLEVGFSVMAKYPAQGLLISVVLTLSNMSDGRRSLQEACAWRGCRERN